MSHVARVDLVISDLDDLEAACKYLGTVELVRHQKTHKWYGQWVDDYSDEDAAYHHGVRPEDYGKCEHAIRLSNGNRNAYEIGVVKNPNGPGYVLVYDNYHGGYGMSEAVGGNECAALKQAYARCAAIRSMSEQGYSYTETKLDNGSMKLHFHRAY